MDGPGSFLLPESLLLLHPRHLLPRHPIFQRLRRLDQQRLLPIEGGVSLGRSSLDLRSFGGGVMKLVPTKSLMHCLSTT